MRYFYLFALSASLCFGQVRNVQVNASNNLTQPSNGINFTSGQTVTASSGVTLNFSSASVSLPATAAITPPSSPSEGDLLVYHSSAWGKLSASTSGYVLTSNGAASLPSYQVSASGFSNPMTTVGDMILGGTAGAATRVAAGTSGYIWTANGAGVAPTWQAATGGGTFPGSSTANALVRFNGTGGSTVKDSNVTLADSGTSLVFSGAAGLSAGGANSDVTISPTGAGSVYVSQVTGSIAALILSAPSPYAGIRVRDASAIRYRSDYGCNSGGVEISAYDDTGATYLPFYIHGSSFKAQGTVQLASYGAGTLTTDASGNVTAVSDARLKNVLGSYGRGLYDLLKVHPVNFKWRPESGNEMEGTYSGFIAQDIQAAIPEAVGEMKNGFLTLQDRPIIAALVNANRELYAMIKALFAAILIIIILLGLVLFKK